MGGVLDGVDVPTGDEVGVDGEEAAVGGAGDGDGVDFVGFVQELELGGEGDGLLG